MQEIEERSKEVVSYVADVDRLKITNQEKFEESADCLVQLKRLEKKIKDYFKPLKQAAKDAHSTVTKKEKSELAPIEAAVEQLKARRLLWKQAQDLKAAKAQAKAEAKEEARAEKMGTDARPVLSTKNVVDKTSGTASGGSTTWIRDIIVDIEDVSQLLLAVYEKRVPYNVIDINKAKLKSYIKAMAITEMSGVKITKTERESIRG